MTQADSSVDAKVLALKPILGSMGRYKTGNQQGVPTMRRLTKRLAIAVSGIVLILATVIVVRTIQYKPAPATEPVAATAATDPGEAASKLPAAIKMRTVHFQEDEPAFRAFLDWLPGVFPNLHRVAPRQIVADLTPLYRWEGKEPELKPILIAAHYDVVDADSSSLDRWTHPPFSGVVSDGFIWGRGSLDNKGAVVAMLEAAEQLTDVGFQPRRTIYFSIGHDEEIGGEVGAASVVRLLNDQGVQLDWSLDEGSFVLDGIVDGIDQPIASINVAQKGMLTLNLMARAPGGHSSMPPRETAVSVLAQAITRLGNRPMPGGLTGVSGTFFDTLARHFPFAQRALFANKWLFGPLIEHVLSSKPTTDAVLRTTMAPTMLSGSHAPNVLPTQATARVNFRLHPRDSIDDVVAFVHQSIADDRIEVLLPTDYMSEASAVSSHETDGYQAIETSIGAAFGDVIHVAGLTLGGTDSRHYARVADNAYRFNPFMINRSDLSRLHGINERLSLDNLGRAISFYRALIKSQSKRAKTKGEKEEKAPRNNPYRKALIRPTHSRHSLWQRIDEHKHTAPLTRIDGRHLSGAQTPSL